MSDPDDRFVAAPEANNDDQEGQKVNPMQRAMAA